MHICDFSNHRAAHGITTVCVLYCRRKNSVSVSLRTDKFAAYACFNHAASNLG